MDTFIEPLKHGGFILGLSLILLLSARVFYGLVHRTNLTIELTQKDNPAAALAFAGYTVAVGIIIAAVAHGPSKGYAEDAVGVLTYGFIGALLLLLSGFLHEFLFHRSIAGTEAIVKSRNLAAAAAKAGSLCATGLVIAGTFGGEGGGFAVVVVYFILGHVVLSLVGCIDRMVARFDVAKEIREGNIAAGISYGGNLLVSGVVLFHASTGNFTDWKTDLMSYAAQVTLGLILIPALRYIFDVIWMPGCKISDEIARDKNWGIVLLEFSVLLVLTCLFVISFS